MNIDAGWQFQLHERVDSLVRRIDDVHQAFVGPDLVLVARVFVDVRRDQDRETLFLHRQRNRALDRSTSTLGGVYNLARRIVDQAMIERLQANTYILISVIVPYLISCQRLTGCLACWLFTQ